MKMISIFLFLVSSVPAMAGGEYSEMQTEHSPCSVYFSNVRLATVSDESIEFALAHWDAPKPAVTRMHKIDREDWLRKVPSFIRIQFEEDIPRNVTMPMRAFPAMAEKLRQYLPTVMTFELAADGLKQKTKYAASVKKIARSDEFDGLRVKVIVWNSNDD